MAIQRQLINERMSQIVTHNEVDGVIPARAIVQAKLCEPGILVELSVEAALK